MSNMRCIRMIVPALICTALIVSMQLPCTASADNTKIKAGIHVKMGWDSIRGLGISGLECKCSYTIRTDSGSGEKIWLFQSEPKITGVDPDGPAEGILRKGDVIVGIDGLLITTRKAGVRFAKIKAGETVELTIRRGSRTLDKKITAENVASSAELEVDGADTSKTLDLDKLSQAIESLALHAEDLSMVLDIPALADLDELIELPYYTGIPALEELSLIQDSRFMPSGWSGFSLSFSGRIVSGRNGETPRWTFDSPPKIREVKDGSPADRAGLRSGDLLTHIDGIKIDSRRGGKLFAVVQPGQEVIWTVKRDHTELDIKMIAEERPRSSEDHGRIQIDEGSLDDISHDKHFHATVGRAEIEVEGDESIKVVEDKEKGEIIITARGIKVRIRDTDKK